MNENTPQRIITLKDIWELFVRRIVVVVLIAALAAGLYYGWNKMNYVPLYESTATLYITRDGEYPNASSSVEAYNFYSLALKVVNDCNYLMTSRSVLEQVIEDLELKMNHTTLASMIKIKNPTSTRILEVTVRAKSPQLAKQIADQLCYAGQERIYNAMGVDYFTLYEYGTLNKAPCNRTGSITYVVVALAAAVVTFGILLLFFLMDDRISSNINVEQVLGLTVLGDIPDRNHAKRSRYGYYYRYGVYGGYGKKSYAYGRAGKKK